MALEYQSSNGKELEVKRRNVLVAGILTTVLSVPALASAADASTNAQTTVKASMSGAAKQESVIVCRLKANRLHESHHVHGTVNVVVNVTCTSRVAEILMQVRLLRNGHATAKVSGRNFGQKSLTKKLAAACHPGTWQAVAGGAIVFPPRYVPPTAKFRPVASNVLHIKHC
jgi:hypothetical protein